MRDADQRRKLGAIYRKASDLASAMYAARGKPAHLSEAQFQRMMRGGRYLWDHMGEAPVILVPCLHQPAPPPKEQLPPAMQARYQDEIAYMDRIRGASIYPAMQNILLACRALGLGTVITTNHVRCENEVKSALGLPDDVFTYALMPIGYSVDKFGPLTRRPLNEVVHEDKWGNAWAGS